MILNSPTTGYTGNGTVLVAASYWSYDQTTMNYPKDFNQNVPGAIYNTESGFMYPGAGDHCSIPVRHRYRDSQSAVRPRHSRRHRHYSWRFTTAL